MHVELKSSKSLCRIIFSYRVCLNLNMFLFSEQVLHLWLEVLCSSMAAVEKWYHPWSFLRSPGWVQIKCELRSVCSNHGWLPSVKFLKLAVSYPRAIFCIFPHRIQLLKNRNIHVKEAWRVKVKQSEAVYQSG